MTNRYWGYLDAALSIGLRRSMDVSVVSKDGQRSLRSSVRTSVLGDGLLERIRSTSLALLGATAAIGLTMVALALNQGWPLIAGAPIPGFGGEQRAGGDGGVAATASARNRGAAIPGPTSQTGAGVSSGKPRPRPGRTVALGRSQAPQTAGLVVARPTAETPAGGSPPSEPAPAPVAEQPAPAPTAATVAGSTSLPPGSVAQATPGPKASGSTEAPEVSPAPAEPPAAAEEEAPEEPESDSPHGPPWSHGGGHAYGYGHDHGHS